MGLSVAAQVLRVCACHLAGFPAASGCLYQTRGVCVGWRRQREGGGICLSEIMVSLRDAGVVAARVGRLRRVTWQPNNVEVGKTDEQR